MWGDQSPAGGHRRPSQSDGGSPQWWARWRTGGRVLAQLPGDRLLAETGPSVPMPGTQRAMSVPDRPATAPQRPFQTQTRMVILQPGASRLPSPPAGQSLSLCLASGFSNVLQHSLPRALAMLSHPHGLSMRCPPPCTECPFCFSLPGCPSLSLGTRLQPPHLGTSASVPSSGSPQFTRWAVAPDGHTPALIGFRAWCLGFGKDIIHPQHGLLHSQCPPGSRAPREAKCRLPVGLKVGAGAGDPGSCSWGHGKLRGALEAATLVPLYR